MCAGRFYGRPRRLPGGRLNTVIVMAYIVMAYIIIASIVMAYIVMAYIDMAYMGIWAWPV